MNLRSAILAATFCAALGATTLVCPPVLDPDSTPVDPTCPGLFATIFVTAGQSAYSAWGNDNPGAGGDFDLNDIVLLVRISTTHDVSLLFLDANSAWVNSASANGSAWVSAAQPFVDVGILPVGTEVILDLHTPDGHQYYSGDPARNAGTPHWWVGQEVPEPRSALLIGVGLLVLGGMARKRRASAHGW